MGGVVDVFGGENVLGPVVGLVVFCLLLGN